MEALRPGDPERLGAYHLLGRLGSGGMGQVFLGRSPGGLPVAIKVVHADLADDKSFRARFRREVNAAKAVSGAFTAAVIDADPDAALPWLATAFLPGLPLQDAVDMHGPFPAPAVCALGAGLAEALSSIHRAGIVHRDLKPSNVMLSPTGPHVIDFGIAHAADASVVTQAGHAIGSPGFLPPEQALGRPTGPAGDVFSLGAVLGYTATGEGPFGKAPAHTLLYRVVHEPPRLDGIAEPELRGLIAACLDKDPGRRPPVTYLLHWLAARAPRTGVLQGTGWLPGPVAADITARAQHAPPDTSPPGTPAHEMTAPSAGTRIGRRRFLAVGGVGAAALTMGAGAAFAVARSGDGSGRRSTTPPPAARSSTTAPPPTRAGKVRWTHDTGGFLESNPTVAGGTVYVGGAKGDLLALDARTGKLRWRHRIARPGENIPGAPAVAGGVVYMGGADGGLYALDAGTGGVRWRYQAGTAVASAAVVVGGTVYAASLIGNIGVGFDGGFLTALHAATGSVRWRRRTKEPINIEFAVAGGVIYLPDDALYALDARTGRVRWTYRSNDAQSPAVAGGMVYFGNFQGEELHAVNASNGRRRWSYRTGGVITARPLVAGGTVYVGDYDGNMYALDAGTGALRWQLQTGGQIESTAVLAGGLVCFASGAFSQGNVYAADPATGRSVWRHELGEGITSSPAAADGAVYVTGKDGKVYALDIQGGTSTVPPTTD